MTLAPILDALVNERRDLSEDEAALAMQALMAGPEAAGGASPMEAAAFLTALRMKGEAVDEIVGLARVMREKSLQVPLPPMQRLADTAGTGGDGQHTFNASTAAAFVVAGCGVPVAKHGNRAMSSSCGSADVLEALGARLDLTPEQVATCIRDTGFGFMFAQAFHPAVKHVAPVRRALGFRTVFNLLGPLTNPAGATHQVVGVATPEIGALMAEALGRLGAKHGIVVHGGEGLDEVSPATETTIWDVRDGAVTRGSVRPEDFHIRPVPLAAVRGGAGDGAAVEGAQMMREVLGGKTSSLTGFVTLNAAAALLAADETPTFAEGVSRAAECIDDGRALRKLELFVETSQRVAAS